MMGKYHVGIVDTGICAGICDDDLQWIENEDVTDEVLCAVRDFLLSMRPDEKSQIGYQWEKKDGGAVKLVLIETFPEEEEDS